MDVKEKSDHHKCSVCFKDADMVCKACKGTPDGAKGITAIYYCSATCQKQDWKPHKPKCKASKDRQILYRAGHIVQRLFVTFCRNTWNSPIDKVESIWGQVMWVYLGRLYIGEIWKIYHGHRTPDMKDYLLPFPAAKFPVAAHQEAVLAQGGCRTAMFLVDDLIKGLLKDTDFQIREICLRIKNPRMMITSIRPGNIPVPIPARHSVYQITLSSGESYALDLTAAQYGWYGPATMPWTTFLEDRLDTILETRKMGETAKELAAEVQGLGSDRIYNHNAIQFMKNDFNLGLAEWQQHNITFKALLRLPENHYEREQKWLLEFWEMAMPQLRAEVNERSEAAGYVPETLSH